MSRFGQTWKVDAKEVSIIKAQALQESLLTQGKIIDMEEMVTTQPTPKKGNPLCVKWTAASGSSRSRDGWDDISKLESISSTRRRESECY